MNSLFARVLLCWSKSQKVAENKKMYEEDFDKSTRLKIVVDEQPIILFTSRSNLVILTNAVVSSLATRVF